METLDLNTVELRIVNETLQNAQSGAFKVANPKGIHAIAAGLMNSLEVEIDGHTGYFCGGMNKNANITINGNAGQGVAQNIMSGAVRVKGNASAAAAATGRGGLVVIEGAASSRCGISMKGVDIVVGGSVGHMSAFMAQAGNLVICGDAGPDLGDSLYEARIFVGGKVSSLGSDCIEKEIKEEHLAILKSLLARAGIEADPSTFKRYGSARMLYNFNIDHAGGY